MAKDVYQKGVVGATGLTISCWDSATGRFEVDTCVNDLGENKETSIFKILLRQTKPHTWQIAF